MASEKIKLDTAAMHAVNATIIKCLDGMKVASLLSKALTPEERRYLARATEAYTSGHFNAALERYKTYIQFKRKLPLNNNDHSRLDVIIQYLVSKCLLRSSQFQDLNEARSILMDLEASLGRIYPMIYLGLAEFYVKVFCFDEAEKMAVKGLSVVERSNFPVCYLPETNIAMLESTTDELTKELTSLKEQCSGWHPPDAKCFMTDCRTTSQSHLCGRNIFVQSPAFNGMVTVTCSNATNPCEIHFHCACWKIKKDEISPVVKISDKEVLLNWECFTPNCGSEDEPSLIKKITIQKEDGTIKDIEPTLDKSQWHAQQAAHKAAARKQKQVIKTTTKTPRMRPPATFDKISENPEGNPHTSDDALHVSHNIQRAEEVERAENTREVLESKLMEMVNLRKTNFNIDPDNDWKSNKAYYGNKHMTITIDSYDPDFSKDSETVKKMKSFLFSHFLSYIENRGPITNDHLMKEWKSLTESSELQPITEELNGIVDVRNFLLQSLKFVAVGNYICIPALLAGTCALVEGKAELKVKEMMEKKTFDFSNGQLRTRKKVEVEVKPEDNPVAGSSAQVEESDPLPFTADDFCDGGQSGESEDDDYSTSTEDSVESQLSFPSSVKDLRVQERKNLEEKSEAEEKNEVEEIDDEIEGIEPLEEDEEEKVEQAPVVNLVQDMMPPASPVNPKTLAKQEKKKRQKKLKLQDPTQKMKEIPQKSGNKKVSQTPKKITERYVVEAESEGTLDDQDELPWDSRPPVHFDSQSCKKCETCTCNKIPEYEATIEKLEEELQITREELRRSAERVLMSEAENQKNLGELQSTKTKLLQMDEELMKTRINLETAINDLKTEQQKFKETKRKMSKDILNAEFSYNYSVITSKIDITQSQYAIVTKLQNLVHQTTNNYLTADWTEWTEPLEKLEKLRSDVEMEHKKLTKLIKNDDLGEDRETAFKSQMNALHLLNLPQRNIPDLIEIAFNMVKIHFQQVMVSCGMAPPAITQGPPIIPLWYQQPRFTPQSLPCGPYHPLTTPMIATGQFHQPGFVRAPYPRHNFQVESYSQYAKPPATIIEVGTAAAAKVSERNKKNPTKTDDSESSEDRSESNQPSKKLQDNSCNWKDVDPGILAAVTSSDSLLDANVSDGSKIQSPAVVAQNPPPPVIAQTPPLAVIAQTPPPAVIAQNSSPAVDIVVSVAQSSEPNEIKSLAAVSSSQLLASASFMPAPLTVNAPPKIVSETARSPALGLSPPIVPALAASSPHPIDKKVKCEERIVRQTAPEKVSAPPAKKSLAGVDINDNQAGDDPSAPVKAQFSEPSVRSDHSSTSQPMGNNQKPVGGLGEVKRPKMQSIDKLMHILRNKHPGVLEYDLIWSVSSVRKTHNNTLTGLPLVQIITEVNKLICTRQKLQLMAYPSSNQVAHVQNPGNNLINYAGGSARDGSSRSSSPSVSSFHREAFTRKNPWSKPQDVTWTKESPESECVICCETLITGTNQPTYTLKCQHTFHKQCLLAWFNQSRSCPTCRVHSTMDDDFPPLP